MDAYERLKEDLEDALLSGSRFTPRQPIEYSATGKAMLERAVRDTLRDYGLKYEIIDEGNGNLTIRPYREVLTFTVEA